MNLEHLSQRLENAGVSVPIFHHSMPADISTGVLLRVPLIGIGIDYELPGYFKTKIQAIVRASKFEIGDPLAKSVQTILTFERVRFTNPDLFVTYMRPETLPIIYPRSESSNIEWSMNFQTVYTEN